MKKKLHNGLWISSTNLSNNLMGSSRYSNFLSSKISASYNLDLLYFMPIKKVPENKKNLIQFNNIFFIEKKPRKIPIIKSDEGCNIYFDNIQIDLIKWIEKNFSIRKYKFVICDYIYLAPIFDFLPRNVLKIINTHDIYGDRYKKLKWGNTEKEKFFSCSSYQEINLLRKSDLVIAISELEAKYFKRLLKSIDKRIFVSTVRYNNNKMLNINRKLDSVPTKKNLILGFIGSSNSINQYGIRKLFLSLDKIQNKNFEFHLAGSICNEIKEEYSWLKKFYIIQEVKLIDYLNSINLMVNPMPKNTTGLKIKTVESFQNNVPIIGTKDAFSGINTKSIWHEANSIEELISLLKKILNSNDLFKKVEKDTNLLKKSYKEETKNDIDYLLKEIENKILIFKLFLSDKFHVKLLCFLINLKRNFEELISINKNKKFLNQLDIQELRESVKFRSIMVNYYLNKIKNMERKTNEK